MVMTSVTGTSGSTAEASRLLPFVAVASRGFAREHAAALTALLVAWDKGATQLQADVPAAARRIAAEKSAPEPSVLLERLGWMVDPGRQDEGQALGLSDDVGQPRPGGNSCSELFARGAIGEGLDLQPRGGDGRLGRGRVRLRFAPRSVCRLGRSLAVLEPSKAARRSPA